MNTSTQSEEWRKTKALAYDIAEAIDTEWPNLYMEGWDVDIATRIVLRCLTGEHQKCEDIELRPAMLERLRVLLGLGDACTTLNILEAAIARISDTRV